MPTDETELVYIVTNRHALYFAEVVRRTPKYLFVKGAVPFWGMDSIPSHFSVPNTNKRFWLFENLSSAVSHLQKMMLSEAAAMEDKAGWLRRKSEGMRTKFSNFQATGGSDLFEFTRSEYLKENEYVSPTAE